MKNLIKRYLRRALPCYKTASIYQHSDVKITNLYKATTFVMPELKDIFGHKHPLFGTHTCQTSDAYIAEINNGRCIIGNEEVFTSKNECLVEITSQKKNPKAGEIISKFIVKRVKGSVVNLSLSGLEDNYYHYNIEWLARLYLLKKSEIKPDYFIVPSNTTFQQEYLNILGIEKIKILKLKKGTLIEADNMIVPSLINNWEIKYCRDQKYHFKKWLPSWTRNIHKSLITLPTVSGVTKKIFLSRKFASCRKITNESELINLASKAGFKCYFMEELTVLEQINLFKDASHIISIHGAGLVNMVHCTQKVRVLELYSQHYHDPGMRMLAVLWVINMIILLEKLIIQRTFLLNKKMFTSIPRNLMKLYV